MTSTVRTIVAVVVLTLFAAAAGAWLGSEYGGHTSHGRSLDEILHNELALTPEQEKRIAALESKFALDRKDLESQMRTANRELARALEAEHAYGDRAKTAIGQFHTAMAALQEQTIIHIVAMRSVLTPEQAERYDKTIREALSSDSP